MSFFDMRNKLDISFFYVTLLRMIDFINDTLSLTSSWLWGYLLIFALLGTHIYLTVILKFPQRYIFKAISIYFHKKDSKNGGAISPFSSLMISLAANIGTGNIIGVATALLVGGPGAIFWCWLTGILGISTRYAESLLSSRYRVRDENGQIVGGPMYVLERGLRWKKMGMLFAALTAIAAFGIGNITQGNAAAGVLKESALQLPTWATGALLSLLVCLVLLGGLKSISKICSACVPTMSLIYIVGCLLLLLSQASYIWPALCLIMESAFSYKAATGGFVGSTIMLAMQTGVQRGLFSNEAGMGSAPIVSAPAYTPNPVKQAVVASSGPFWDTVVICTLTGLALTTSLIAHPDLASEDRNLFTFHAFGTMGYLGSSLLTISLLTFVISTLLGWSYFGERALQYLGGRRLIIPYRLLWVVATFVGCVIPKSSIVWNFADIANGLMALPNLLSMIALSGVLIHQTRYYLWANRLDEVSPHAIPDLQDGDQPHDCEKSS